MYVLSLRNGKVEFHNVPEQFAREQFNCPENSIDVKRIMESITSIFQGALSTSINSHTISLSSAVYKKCRSCRKESLFIQIKGKLFKCTSCGNKIRVRGKVE